MRQAVLSPGWMLRGWSDMPFALVRWGNGACRPLSLDSYYVLSSCDAQSDFDGFAFLPKHRRLLDGFLADGIVAACGPEPALASIQTYRKADNPFIRGIEWNITGRCNLKCRHCYMESPAGRYGHPPLRELERLADQFAEANVLEVSLTGGEPFLRDDLLTLLELLAARGIWVGQIYSNGLLIRQRHLERIRALGLLPAFQISFDGVHGHDDMRGVRGVERPTIAAIRRVAQAGFPVVVATSIDRRNAAGLSATYALMRALGIVSWRVSMPERAGNWRNQDSALSLAEAYAVCEPIARRWAADDRPFHIQLAGFFKAGPRSDLGGSEPDLALTPASYDCRTCREQANVLPDGTLVPCPGYVDSAVAATMPNLLRDMPLSRAWAHPRLRRFADLRLGDVLAENPGCATCADLSACGIGCRAAALADTGRLLAKDQTTCQLFRGGFRQRMRDSVLAAAAVKQRA